MHLIVVVGTRTVQYMSGLPPCTEARESQSVVGQIPGAEQRMYGDAAMSQQESGVRTACERQSWDGAFTKEGSGAVGEAATN